MLKVRDLVVAYGGIEALKGISIDVPDGQIVTLIGANGAGKSTLLRTIMGLVKPKSGTVEYNDEVLNGLNSQRIVSRGITLVPEGRRVFPNLTVLENLRIGAYLRKDDDGIAADIKRIYELFPRLEERHWQMAGTLSGGEQQMLAVGRAMMMRPKLMMMDEPSLGLAPIVINTVFRMINEIREGIAEDCFLQQTPYVIFVGIGFDRIGGEADTFQKCITRADDNLYIDKKNCKLNNQTTMLK